MILNKILNQEESQLPKAPNQEVLQKIPRGQSPRRELPQRRTRTPRTPERTKNDHHYITQQHIIQKFYLLICYFVNDRLDMLNLLLKAQFNNF